MQEKKKYGRRNFQVSKVKVKIDTIKIHYQSLKKEGNKVIGIKLFTE